MQYYTTWYRVFLFKGMHSDNRFAALFVRSMCRCARVCRGKVRGGVQCMASPTSGGVCLSDPLSHRYALQLNLYREVLTAKYSLNIRDMCLVQLSPEAAGTYRRIVVRPLPEEVLGQLRAGRLRQLRLQRLFAGVVRVLLSCRRYLRVARARLQSMSGPVGGSDSVCPVQSISELGMGPPSYCSAAASELIPIRGSVAELYTVQPLPDASVPLLFAEARAQPLTFHGGAHFQRRWEALTHSLFKKLRSWGNVVVAGGAVLRCMECAGAEEVAGSSSYATGDVDVFLYGLSQEAGLEKVGQVVRALCKQLRRAGEEEVVVVRTAYTLSIKASPRYPKVQVVLALHPSLYAVVDRFDVDCCCVVWDGEQVCTPHTGQAGVGHSPCPGHWC